MNESITTVRVVEAARCALHVEEHIYDALAKAMLVEIGPRNYITTTLEVEDGDLFFEFVCSAIIYRRTEEYPEGAFEAISDVVPVWWELSSFRGDEQVLNDATFDKLKRYLIE